MSEVNTQTATAASQEQTATPEELALFDEMTKAGILYGRKKSKTNPKMGSFVFAVRSGVSLYDLSKVKAQLDEAAEFLRDVTAKGGQMLMVGTQPVARDLIHAAAAQLTMPYVTERWLGGTLTNFQTIAKRIRHFKKLKSDRESGALGKYTKKERVQFDREIGRMTKLFGGIETLDELPHALFVIDAKVHAIAVHEANNLNIPVVAIAHSDNDPDLLDAFVPANASSKPSIAWVLERLVVAMEAGKQQYVANREARTKEVVAKEQSASEAKKE